MTKFIWRNGEYITEDKVGISTSDTGLVYGGIAFETMRVYNGVCFKLGEHVNRLKQLADQLNIKVTVSAKSLEQVVNRLTKLNSLPEACIRIILTSGIEEPNNVNSNMIVEACAAPDYNALYKQGVKVITYPYSGMKECSVQDKPALKFLENRLAYLKAREQGVTEVIRFNRRNKQVTEATQNNVFIVKHNRILTPPVESLNLPAQVMRTVISGLATKFHLKLREEAIKLNELVTSNEMFLAGPLMEIVPVVECDNQKIADGKPGFMTQSLLHAHRDSLT